jgi:halogenation protein CepH
MEKFDAVVVGGGPGGSTVASLLSMQGHRALVLEKEKFPRYQIGESLLPATVQGICRLVGAWDALARAGFVQKKGATFRWGASPEPWSFAFPEARVAGRTSYAYQVERMKFDQIMLDNARRLGADVREECSATEVLENKGRVCGVKYTSEGGAEHEISADFVIDASGNGSRLWKSVGGQRQYSEFFRSLALFGYFDGGKRLPGAESGNIFSVAFESGWFWYIPLSATLTSVGAVVRHDMAGKIQGDPEQALASLIAECPVISDYLSGAKRITAGEYGKLRVRKDYSYSSTRFWRPGMALVGDAACFVDPVLSSGVHLATYGGLLAARSVNSVMAGVVDELAAFREFEARYRREYGIFYQFLMAFYDTNVTEASYFWEAKKIIESGSPELESFVELTSGVASGESALINAEEVAKRVRSASMEFGRAIGEMDTDPSGSIARLLNSPVAGPAIRKIVGENEDEAPLLADDLVASADGLLWMIPERPPEGGASGTIANP